MSEASPKDDSVQPIGAESSGTHEKLDADGLDDGWTAEELAGDGREELLAKIAAQSAEIARLRARVERTETALANALERLAITSIHEARTLPPAARPTTPTKESTGDAEVPALTRDDAPVIEVLGTEDDDDADDSSPP